MGRKNKRKRSAYSRKMKTNPKKLINQKMGTSYSQPVHGCGKAVGSRIACGNDSTVSNRTPIRGDIWYADLGSHPGTSVQGGCRPVFVMSNDKANEHSETLTVVPLTSRLKKSYLPTHVALSAADCLSLEPSMALAEQVTTVGKPVLRSFVGRVNAEKIQEIERAVEVHLGLAITTAAV